MSIEQIHYIDNLLPFYGCKGVDDTTSIFNKNSFTDWNLLKKKLNDDMDYIRKTFSVKLLNLARLNFRIETKDHAMAIMRGFLKLTGINFSIVRHSNAEYVRLSPENKNLLYYIIHKRKMGEGASNNCDFEVTKKICGCPTIIYHCCECQKKNLQIPDTPDADKCGYNEFLADFTGYDLVDAFINKDNVIENVTETIKKCYGPKKNWRAINWKVKDVFGEGKTGELTLNFPDKRWVRVTLNETTDNKILNSGNMIWVMCADSREDQSTESFPLAK